MIHYGLTRSRFVVFGRDLGRFRGDAIYLNGLFL
jgi:hypothetical protein